MITLTLKDALPVPLEAESLCPDVVAGLTPGAVGALPVYLGKRHSRVDDFFEVAGEPGDELEIRGDLAKVKWLGRGMTRGRIHVVGNAGMHLGASMKGGSIEVDGNVSDWLGAEMSGGTIRIRGNSGGQVGSAYRGSLTGMSGGFIAIDGHAGLEVGSRMRRGTIAIGGRARDFTGLQMKGGTIFLRGGAELRTGAWMARGTIVTLAELPLLPTFSYASTDEPTFLRLITRQLTRAGFAPGFEEGQGVFERHTGDSSVPGKGEILIFRPRAA